MPITLVLLARIIVHVSASKNSATMTATTHKQQVFSQVSPVFDFKLMAYPPLRLKADYCAYIYILVGIPEFLYR